MHNGYIFVGGMTAGIAIGSIAAYTIVKKHYAKKAQQQITEVIAYYTRKKESDSDNQTQVENHVGVEKEEHVERDNPDDYSVEKSVISMLDVTDDPTYDTETFTLYADGVLTDDSDIPLSPEKIDNIFGPDMYDQICRCDGPRMYIKDPSARAIYEVLMCDLEFND